MADILTTTSMSSTSSPLAGKVAIVTGASAGLGVAIANALAAAGAKVVISGRDRSRLEGVQQNIIKAGGVATVHVGDARLESTQQELVELAVATYGGLHIAVNNAGVYHFGPLEQQGAEQIDDMVDLNIKGIIYGLKHQLPAMGRFSSATEWGNIINISTGGTKRSSGVVEGGAFVYGVTKVAVDHATYLGAAAGRPHHVKVNGIAPGPIFTPGHVSVGMTEQSSEAFAKAGTLLERSGKVGDVSDLVLFLVGKTGNYIDGAVFTVDGGFSVK